MVANVFIILVWEINGMEEFFLVNSILDLFSVMFPKFTEYLLLHCPSINPFNFDWIKNAAKNIIQARMNNEQVSVYLYADK